jgi:hypothetical protein
MRCEACSAPSHGYVWGFLVCVRCARLLNKAADEKGLSKRPVTHEEWKYHQPLLMDWLRCALGGGR